jgi:hypothetical protein
MSDDTGQMLADKIRLQKQHIESIARLQGQKPTQAMEMTREELLESFGDLVGLRTTVPSLPFYS